MARPLRTIVLCAGLMGVAPSLARPQAVPVAERIGAQIASHQNADGGFGPVPGGESTLGSTSSAIRSLGYVAGSIPQPLACIDFVRSCIDPATGGFAQRPGGKPDVGTTASGLMALGELRAADQTVVDRAVAYLAAAAQSYEEIRIAAAGLEAVGARLDAESQARWKASLLAGRNADGTWGAGAAQAFDTGGRAAALLRLGVDLDARDAIVATLLAAQQPDGGWKSKEGAATDLSATYRIVRALYMLEKAPNLTNLRRFVAGHQRENSLYSASPEAPGVLGTSYYGLILDRWANLFEGLEPRVETAGFKPLFNGSDLNGWEGEAKYWSVENGRLVGQTTGLDHNTFLTAPGSHRDFALKFTFKLDKGAGNSGVQFRSTRVPPHEMSGYQSDIGESYWGSLYDESRRNRTLATASESARKAVRESGWNHYTLRAFGPHISQSVNGQGAYEYTETDSDVAPAGQIATQLHAGGPMRIEFQNLLIQEVPSPEIGDELTPGFHLRTLDFEGSPRRFTLYLPPGYDGTRPLPVVIFLHGSGERGDDGKICAQVGLGPAIASDPARYPFIGVFPQARETWAAGSPDAKAALATLDEVQRLCKVDPSRIVLSGLSMGGGGSWSIGASQPERFSAVVPVCGYGDAPTALKLKGKPVWALIGDADSPRLLDSTRLMVRALRDAGSPPRYTEYRTIGHNSWDRAYTTPELITWMLEQRNGAPRP